MLYYYFNGFYLFDHIVSPIFDHKLFFLMLGEFLSLGQFKSKYNHIKPRWR